LELFETLVENSETGFIAYIMIAIDFFYHNIRITSWFHYIWPRLKYRKNEKVNFLTPHFLRTEDHLRSYMRVILIALDELYYTSFSYSVCLHLSTFLVQKKKNTIFDPKKVTLFSKQCWVFLVYSWSTRLDLQES
jgi:hypothetical protein